MADKFGLGTFFSDVIDDVLYDALDVGEGGKARQKAQLEGRSMVDLTPPGLGLFAMGGGAGLTTKAGKPFWETAKMLRDRGLAGMAPKAYGASHGRAAVEAAKLGAKGLAAGGRGAATVGRGLVKGAVPLGVAGLGINAMLPDSPEGQVSNASGMPETGSMGNPAAAVAKQAAVAKAVEEPGFFKSLTEHKDFNTMMMAMGESLANPNRKVGQKGGMAGLLRDVSSSMGNANRAAIAKNSATAKAGLEERKVKTLERGNQIEMAKAIATVRKAEISASTAFKKAAAAAATKMVAGDIGAQMDSQTAKLLYNEHYANILTSLKTGEVSLDQVATKEIKGFKVTPNK